MRALTSWDNATTLLETLFPNEPYWDSFLVSLTEGCAEEYDQLTSYYTFDETYIDQDELLAFAIIYGRDKIPEVGIKIVFTAFHDRLRFNDQYGLHSKMDLVMGKLDQVDVHFDPILKEQIKMASLGAQRYAEAGELIAQRFESMKILLKEKLAINKSKGLLLKEEAA